ncbi:MAG: transcriptional regulator PpsR [Steroidobacteraceae bacterium]|nr:transcriptional regulator PpsR [Steroidobacteraceae bacterium]
MKAFSAAKQWLGEVDAQTAAQFVAVASDVALLVAPRDVPVIRDVAFGSNELAREITEDWTGRAWLDLVTIESRPKVEALVRDALANAPPRWRHVNHRSPSGGEDIPVLYAALPVAGGTSVLAMGRSLRPIATLQQRLLDAQQSMDREYSRMRQAETRHRLLFQLSSEAVLIVDAASRRVVEANPSSARLLGAQERALIGRPFPERLDAASERALETLLATVRATGRTEETRVRTADGAHEFLAAVSLFREERGTFFLVRLAPHGGAAGNGHAVPRASRVLELVENGPDGFLVTDPDGRIEYANRAFLDMAQLATEELARGESLERWLGRPGVDFGLLSAHLKEHRSIRLFATTVRGEYGSVTDVEICAVAVPDAEQPRLGFTVRNVSHRVAAEKRVHRERPRSVEQLTELVGRVPLKELVRESSDMIERLCIEAALELTGDNRASAAEILGLSRQSLYAKLRRYGLGDLVSTEDDAEPPASA